MRRLTKREQDGQKARVDFVAGQDLAHEGLGNVHRQR